MTASEEAIMVHIATPGQEEAQRLARLLLGENLASACQISPIYSLYWWQEELHEADEWLLRAITHPSRFGQIKDLIFAEHSYDLPEVISYPIQDIPEEYVAWIKQYTEKGQE